MNIPLNIDWQQILLHLFNFAILVAGLYLLLYNPVKKFIKKREDHYVQVDQEAEGKRQEAAELAEQHRVRLQEVDKEIALKKAEAQKEIDSMREEQLAEAQKQAEIDQVIRGTVLALNNLLYKNVLVHLQNPP